MKSSAIFSAFIFVLFLCFTALPAQARTSHQQNSSPAYSQSVQKHHHKASVKHRHSSAIIPLPVPAMRAAIMLPGPAIQRQLSATPVTGPMASPHGTAAKITTRR